MRNISPDHYFHADNKPPKEYLRNDVKYLEKPGRLNLKEVNTDNLPLAGKLTDIG